MWQYKLHLYHNQEEIVYDHVFVRVVSGPDTHVVVRHSSSGAAAPPSIAVSVSNCFTKSIANA